MPDQPDFLQYQQDRIADGENPLPSVDRVNDLMYMLARCVHDCATTNTDSFKLTADEAVELGNMLAELRDLSIASTERLRIIHGFAPGDSLSEIDHQELGLYLAMPGIGAKLHHDFVADMVRKCYPKWRPVSETCQDGHVWASDGVKVWESWPGDWRTATHWAPYVDPTPPPPEAT